MTARSTSILRPTLLLTASLAAAWLAVSAAAQGAGGDWPQWRGPGRTGVSAESGLLKTWPQGGPRQLWMAEGLGGGYSSPSVAGGKVFGMGYRGGDEVVWALDAASGRGLWLTRIAAANRNVGYGEGSRSTPTVDGGRLYVLGVSGDLACLEAVDGRLVWQKNLVSEFGGRLPNWGYAESPLVDGDRVIACPGGRQATIVALRKASGEVVWRAQVPGGDAAQYASAIVADVEGQRQYVAFMQGGVVAVDAATGAFRWRYDTPANRTANCSTPIFRDGHVFAASGYNTGGGLARIRRQGETFEVEEVYATRNMKNHHGGMVLIGDHLYGSDDPGRLTCIEFKTGRVMWAERSVGKGSLTAVDGKLVLRGESRGDVALVDASPQGYVERGRLQQPDRSTSAAWPHPVVAGGRLFLRDQDRMFVYDVKGGL